jgi:hypothetical protein
LKDKERSEKRILFLRKERNKRIRASRTKEKGTRRGKDKGK